MIGGDARKVLTVDTPKLYDPFLRGGVEMTVMDSDADVIRLRWVIAKEKRFLRHGSCYS